jgi:hypothetical protein
VNSNRAYAERDSLFLRPAIRSPEEISAQALVDRGIPAVTARIIARKVYAHGKLVAALRGMHEMFKPDATGEPMLQWYSREEQMQRVQAAEAALAEDRLL